MPNWTRDDGTSALDLGPSTSEKATVAEKQAEAEKRVLAAAKRLATAYLKYGKELDSEIQALAKAAEKCWPKLKEFSR